MSAISTYGWKARSNTGELLNGTMAAESAEEVARTLRSEGRVVLEVSDRVSSGGSTLDAAAIRRQEAVQRIKRDEVIAFCDQLSVMVETGVPLAEALETYARQGASREFTIVLDRVRDDLFSGGTFSEATARWPRVFPRIMTSLLRASEVSGTMGLMLRRVSEYLGGERKTLRQVRGAIAYPAFMMTAGLALSGFLLIFVLPRFATIYEDRSAELPMITEIMLGASRLVVHKWMYWAPGIGTAVLSGYLFSRRPSGRRVLDWLRLNVPIIGPLYRQLYLTRATRTMATLLQGGVHLLDIISISRDVTNNVYYDRLWDRMEGGVREGRLISSTLENDPLVPAAIVSMISAGEKSGRLPDVMNRIAEFGEQEFDARVKGATSFIEPIMVITMGIVIGAVAIALLLPIFQMGNVVAGG